MYNTPLFILQASPPASYPLSPKMMTFKRTFLLADISTYSLTVYSTRYKETDGGSPGIDGMDRNVFFDFFFPDIHGHKPILVISISHVTTMNQYKVS